MEVEPRKGRSDAVLLLGCGSIGRRHARVLRDLGVTDLRVYDPDDRQIQRLAAESGPVRSFGSVDEALRAGPGLVFVLTPPASHIPLSIQALRAGCDVFCEKPLSDGAEELPSLEACIRETGRTFMVGLCFRYHEGLLKARQLVLEGAIGRVLSIRSFMGEHLPTVRPDYRALFSATTIGVFDLIHDIDLAIWFAGESPVRVASMYGSVSDMAIDAPDLAEIIMRFPSGPIASVHLDYFQLPRRRFIEVSGTAGTMSISFSEWTHYRIETAKHGEPVSVIEGATERDDMFRDEDREFLKAAVEHRPARTGFNEGRASVDALSAIWRTDQSGSQGER
ncbi:Gfo/Idh/MocA family protein [Salinispira pacifica]